MPALFSSLLDSTLNASDSGLLQMVLLAYFGLLWLAIIIWVTRDSIHRSSSLFFQTFAIILNILVPVLGVLLYLIIRPAKTNMESYYEELEHRLLSENADTPSASCEKCLTPSDAAYTFCPNCGEKMKQACRKCKKSFPTIWHICPFCGQDQGEVKVPTKRPKKRLTD